MSIPTIDQQPSEPSLDGPLPVPDLASRSALAGHCYQRWAQSWEAAAQPASSDVTLSPMQLVAWWQACDAAFERRSSQRAAAVYAGARPVALAPLCKSSRRWQLWQEPPGARRLYEPSEFLHRSDPALDAMAEQLVASRTALVLPRVLMQSATAKSLQRAYRGRGRVVCRPSGGCPYIEIDPTVAEAELLLSKRLRSDLRRARRKADQLGDVQFEIAAPLSENDFAGEFERFLEIEAAGWKGASGTAVGRDPDMERFFRQFGAAATRQGILRFAWMHIERARVAGQLAIESGRRFWLLKIGFDEQYAKCSPGQLLMLETLRYAMQQGLVSYEFLGNAADWTRRWTATERETIELALFPPGLRGMLAYSAWLAQKAYGRWRRGRA